jgi:hypothetical protein
MFRISMILNVLLLALAVAGSRPAWAEPAQDSQQSAQKQALTNELNLPRYHLVTPPSTNKKRVDAMCIRFLSQIPKAKLIPKTEEVTVYRLVENVFDTAEAARKRKVELLRHCESPFVLKSDQGYTLVAGSQLTEALALEEQKRLAARKITTKIQELKLPLRQWQMQSAESFTVRDAVGLASRLAEKGVVTTIEQKAVRKVAVPVE